MPDAVIVNNADIQQWLADKLDAAQLQENLHARGWDDECIATHLRAFKKARSAKRQFAGFMYLGAGALTGFISCVLTLVNPVPELYYWILFGLTSVSMTLIFVGLYNLFE